jgi:hypothetical protein
MNIYFLKEITQINHSDWFCKPDLPTTIAHVDNYSFYSHSYDNA